MQLRFHLRCAIVVVLGGLFSSVSAFAETGGSFKIATFNVEFLTYKRLHVKYGLPFFLNPGDTDRQAIVKSIINGGDDDAPKFLRDYDEDPQLQAKVHEWGDETIRRQRLDTAINEVAQYISTLDTDVLVLTEIGLNGELDRLVELLSELGADYPHYELCKCFDRYTQQGVAVISKLPLLEVLPSLPGKEGYLVEFDDAVAEKSTRLSKAMRVKVKIADQYAYIFVAHLKSELGTHDSDAQRIAQASILRRLTIPLLDRCESPEGEWLDRDDKGKCPPSATPVHVIVAGDLNDHRGQPAIRRVRGFDDIYPDLLQTGRKEFFEESELDQRWTKQYEGILNQIDHILLSESMFGMNRDAGFSGRTIIKTKMIENSDSRISDHRPVVVDVLYKHGG